MSESKSLTISLHDEITFENESFLKKEVLDQLYDGLEELVFDLSDLTYIDSSGISMLIYFDKLLKSRSGRLYLTKINKKILGILELGRMMQYFTVK